MKHTIGSVLQLIPGSPDHKVKITWKNGEHDYAPLIGWAIVVTWNGDPKAAALPDDDEGEQETDIEPVALFEGEARSKSSLRLEHPGISYEVLRP